MVASMRTGVFASAQAGQIDEVHGVGGLAAASARTHREFCFYVYASSPRAHHSRSGAARPLLLEQSNPAGHSP